MFRILHISDVHVDTGLHAQSFFHTNPKRLVGGMNHLLRRGVFFRDAEAKLKEYGVFAREEGVDLVIASGDFTILGTEEELRFARQAIDPLTHVPHGMVAVAGNHDVYVNDVVEEKRFEKYFGEFLKSDTDITGGEAFPIIRYFPSNVVVIGLASAKPNHELWKSSGFVPPSQITQLDNILSTDFLPQDALVFVVSHYGLFRADGSPDSRFHRLENAQELERVIRKRPRTCLLHGHIHRRMRHDLGNEVTVLGAGSATQEGKEGFWMIEVLDGANVRAVPGRFADGKPQLDFSGASPLFQR